MGREYGAKWTRGNCTPVRGPQVTFRGTSVMPACNHVTARAKGALPVAPTTSFPSLQAAFPWTVGKNRTTRASRASRRTAWPRGTTPAYHSARCNSQTLHWTPPASTAPSLFPSLLTHQETACSHLLHGSTPPPLPGPLEGGLQSDPG